MNLKDMMLSEISQSYKKVILYDPMYIIFKNWQSESMVMGIRKLVTVGVGTDWEEVQEVFVDARNILYLNLGDSATHAHISKNSVSLRLVHFTDAVIFQ